MNKTSIILTVVILSLLIIGLLIYGFVIVPKQKNPSGLSGATTNNNSGSGDSSGTIPPTSTPTTTFPQADIEKLADDWDKVFRVPSGRRCAVIEQVNKLNDIDLAYFSNFYLSKYQKHPIVPYENAFYWCFWGDDDDKLHKRFKAQLA